MRALIISADNFEDSELLVPFYRLKEEKAEVDVVSVKKGKIKGKHGYEVEVNKSLREVVPGDYDVLILPGGKAPEAVRKEKKALEIARHFFEKNKPVSAICHGPQTLITAGVLKGRKATCYRSVAGEMKDAGAVYEDSEVVVDGNLITSRQPADLPAFMRETVGLLRKRNILWPEIMMRLADLFHKTASIDPDDAKRMLSERGDDIILLDVREPREYEQGHIPGAVLMPMSVLPDRMKELDPSRTVISYWKRGGRSSSAAAFLKGQGFGEVYSIRGGMDAWNGLKATGEYEAGMYLIEGRKTMEEFLSLAWSLEDGTGAFYEAVMNTIQGKELKSVFHSLVKAEENHKAALLETYRRIKGDTIKSEALAERSLSGLMEGGVSVEEAVAWAKQRDRDPRDILEFSMQLETNSLDLYMKVLRAAEDEGVRETFRSLIDEEKLHLARLGNLLNRVYNV